MNARQVTMGGLMVAVGALGTLLATYSDLGLPEPVFQTQYRADMVKRNAAWEKDRARVERAMRQLQRKVIALAKSGAATRIELLYLQLPPLEGPERAARVREIETWERIINRLHSTSTDVLIETPFTMEGLDR